MSSSCISILCILPVLNLRSKKHLRHILCIYLVMLYLYIPYWYISYYIYILFYLLTCLPICQPHLPMHLFFTHLHIYVYTGLQARNSVPMCLYIVMWHKHSESCMPSTSCFCTAKGAADCCRSLGKHQSMAEAWWSAPLATAHVGDMPQ